jgi:hypothetical protein
MRNIFLSVILAFSIVALSGAQDYKTGIGLRAGFSNGITLKHFVSDSRAFEGLLASHWGGLDVTGLYEIHDQAFDVEHLNWYYGFGGHLGSYSGNPVSGTVVGIDGILGIEYTFTEAPINIGLDWKPAFNIIGNSAFWPDGGALSVRYVF